MTFLFDPGYPPSIVKAISLILGVGKNRIVVQFYIEEGQDDSPEHAVVFLLDDARKGINEQTRLYVESGYRVFAYKLPRGKQLSRLDMGLTMMQVLPKILSAVKEKVGPFLYLIRHKKTRLSATIITPPKPALQRSIPVGNQPIVKREKRKQIRPIPDSIMPLFP